MHVMDTDIPKGGVGISKSYTSPNTHNNQKEPEQGSSESQITNLTNQKSKVQFLETAPSGPLSRLFPPGNRFQLSLCF